jgi:hypothetical protein
VISTMRRRHPAAARLWLIAVKRATIDSNAHPISSSRATGKRTRAPAIKPGYGATNLGGHRDDPIRRHATVQPHERSGDVSIAPVAVASQSRYHASARSPGDR